MRFVPAKSTEQQDLQALHRIRSRLIGNRTQLSNQIRGLLAEYGIALPQQLSQLRTALPMLLEEFRKQLAAIYRRSSQCRRIAEVEGIGPVTATAILAAICAGKSFSNGRQLSAWLGLVPRQHSSGVPHHFPGTSLCAHGSPASPFLQHRRCRVIALSRRRYEASQRGAVFHRPINWLWTGWIAKGKTTLIAGDPGL